jgi:hypothetical protein
MGICIGGHLAFRAAMNSDVAGTACFYATDIHKGSLGKGMKDDSLLRAKDIKGELLMIWGRQDPHIPLEGDRSAAEKCLRRRTFSSPVQPFMATSAKRYQVQVVIVALLAAVLLVVDMQVFPGTTDLASPAIAAQYLFSQLVVRFGIEPQAGSLESNLLHKAIPATWCRKACRCSPGRNLKKRDIDWSSAVGSSLSKFAPARKSAQIISRQ